MTKPIRILQCFARMDRGGSETMIMNLYRNIDRNRIQFDFVVHTNEKCEFDDEIIALGGKIYRVPRFKITNFYSYIKAWNMLFKEHKGTWSIIHGHMFTTSAIYLKIAKNYGLTSIAHSHNTSSGHGLRAFIKVIIQFPIRFVADYYFACSKNAGTWLFGKRACRKDNFYVFNNAIDSKNFIYDPEIRTKKRIELQLEDKFVVGHVGRFHKQKNHDFIVDIFNEIYRKNESARLLLIGDGFLRKSIEKKVNDLGLSNYVIFAGVRSDIPEILQALDLFLFPSLYEGLPVTLVEAQASGLMVRASDTITREVAITDLIDFYSLKSPATYWANEILKNSEANERENKLDEIIKARYDIKQNTKWLEEFYTICYKT